MIEKVIYLRAHRELQGRTVHGTIPKDLFNLLESLWEAFRRARKRWYKNILYFTLYEHSGIPISEILCTVAEREIAF